MRRASIFAVILATSLLVAIFPSVSVAQGMTPVFGPQQYNRTTAAPQTFTDTFGRCGTSACQLPPTAHRNRNPRPRQQLQQDPAGAGLEPRFRLRLSGAVEKHLHQ